YVEVGASPRGAQGLFNGSKVEAILKGRLNVAFEDINDIAYAVLRHRIFLNFEAVSEGITTDMVIKEVIKSLKVI
ncbi:MAG TPA: AAA family ATPase, partial [Clostridium sp.]|nr:AAA family ATPase [Clostridium sp.]